jgi:hypothetical protein
VAIPSAVAPSVNAIVPVGVPFAPVRVAVSVTEAPNVAGLGVAVRAIIAAAALTFCVSGAEVLAL